MGFCVSYTHLHSRANREIERDLFSRLWVYLESIGERVMPVPSNLYKTSTPTASKTAKLNTQSASKTNKPIKSSTTQTSTSGSTTTTTTTSTTTQTTATAATTTATLAATTVTQLAKTTVIKQDVVKPHLSLTSTPVSEILIDQVVDDNNTTTVLNQTSDPDSENSFIEDLLEQPNLLFYIWTVALATLLALFIFKKFKQWKRMQARQAAAAQQKNAGKQAPTVQTAGLQQRAQQISPKPKPQIVTGGQPPIQQINLQAQQQPIYVVVLLKMFDLLKIVLTFLFAMAKILFSWLLSSTTNGDFFIPTSDTGLDNFFKWFYFNLESTRSVNSTVLNALNETANKHQPKVSFKLTHKS